MKKLQRRAKQSEQNNNDKDDKDDKSESGKKESSGDGKQSFFLLLEGESSQGILRAKNFKWN